MTHAETPPEKAKQSPLQELTRKAKALQTALKAERAVASDLIERTAAQPQPYKCLNNEWGVGELRAIKAELDNGLTDFGNEMLVHDFKAVVAKYTPERLHGLLTNFMVCEPQLQRLKEKNKACRDALQIAAR